MRKFLVSDLISLTDGHFQVIGDPSGKYFDTIANPKEATTHSLIFITNYQKNKQSLLEETQAQIIICDQTFKIAKKKFDSKCFMIVKDPKLLVARVGNKLLKPKLTYGIHKTAVIDKKAKIGRRVFIGPFCHIGKCTIQDGTIIYGHCYLYNDVQIGKNVIIHAGAVIGASGFGYVKNLHSEYENFPQLKGVVIEDNVEIGANTCIDRGALTDTIIHEGTKIDNLVHIAHNCQIGRNTLITAQVIISGSTIVGNNCYFAPNSSVNEYLTIGDNAFIATGSVVTKNVPKNETWIGAPARPIKDFRKYMNKLKKI